MEGCDFLAPLESAGFGEHFGGKINEFGRLLSELWVCLYTFSTISNHFSTIFSTISPHVLVIIHHIPTIFPPFSAIFPPFFAIFRHFSPFSAIYSPFLLLFSLFSTMFLLFFRCIFQLTVEFAARILGRLSAVFGGATGRSVGKLVRAAERLRVGERVAVAGWQWRV
jgi:hypothetical protein